MLSLIERRPAAVVSTNYLLLLLYTHSVIHKHSTAGSRRSIGPQPQLPGAELMIVTWAVGAELLCCIMCCVLCCVVLCLLYCVVLCCNVLCCI